MTGRFIYFCIEHYISNEKKKYKKNKNEAGNQVPASV